MSSEFEFELEPVQSLERAFPQEPLIGPIPATGKGGMVVRKVLRRNRFWARIGLEEETAVSLVTAGLKRASLSAGVSGRTLRRHFARDGASISTFVSEVTLESARELYAEGWGTDEVAAALGYASTAGFRRFLRQNSGGGVWSLRRAAAGPMSQ